MKRGHDLSGVMKSTACEDLEDGGLMARSPDFDDGGSESLPAVKAALVAVVPGPVGREKVTELTPGGRAR